MATILLLMDTGFAGWIRQALVQNNEQAIVAVTSEQKRCALGDSQWNWLGIWHRSSLRCLVMGMPLLAICAMTPGEAVGEVKKAIRPGCQWDCTSPSHVVDGGTAVEIPMHPAFSRKDLKRRTHV